MKLIFLQLQYTQQFWVHRLRKWNLIFILETNQKLKIAETTISYLYMNLAFFKGLTKCFRVLQVTCTQ